MFVERVVSNGAPQRGAMFLGSVITRGRFDTLHPAGCGFARVALLQTLHPAGVPAANLPFPCHLLKLPPN